MSYKTRPIGITILVILEVMAAVLILVAGLAFAAFADFIYRYIPPGTIPPALWSGIAVFGGALLVIGALICFLLAWGMWTGKTWCWYLALIFAVLGALGGLTNLPSGIGGLLINGAIIWYLWQRHVRAFFSMGAPTTRMPPPAPAPSATKAGNVVYCPKCGTANPSSSIFCTNCGAELKPRV